MYDCSTFCSIWSNESSLELKSYFGFKAGLATISYYKDGIKYLIRS